MGAAHKPRVRPDTPLRPGASATRRTLPSTRVLFLLALAVLAAAYTAMAFGLEWRVASGQIGPGFFPRFVGAATVVGCLVAVARGDRRASSRSVDADEDAEHDPPVPDADEPAPDADAQGTTASGTDAKVVVAAIGCMVLYYLVFEVAGAALASVLFLALMLTVVNPGHHRANAAVSVLVPAALYLLFEVLLDAGLPPGLVLPL